MSHNSQRHSTKSLVVLLPILTISLVTLTSYSAGRSTPSKVDGRSEQKNRDQELARVFKKSEIVKLDASATARRVRESGRLSLISQSGTFDLYLTQHDLRAHGYLTEEVGPDGIARVVEMGPVHTYKGTVSGMKRAQARFTISNESIEGVIITETARYYIEPAKRFSASADASEFVFYKASDVAFDLGVKCCFTI